MADTPMDTLTEATEKAQAPCSETPEQRSERMRKLAQRPRGTRRSNPKQATPAYLRTLIGDVDGLERHELLRRYSRELQAELDAAGITTTPKALFTAAVRCRAVYELVESVTFKEIGGPVHRRKRALHEYVKQRAEVLAGWLSMRARIGLDKDLIANNPTNFAEAFRAMVEAPEHTPDAAEQLRKARERSEAHRLQMQADEKAETERRIAEAVARATGAPWPPPELLTGPPTEPAQAVDACNPPAPTEPEAWRHEYMGAVAGPPLELEPEVQDLGNVRIRAPSLDELRQHQQPSAAVQVFEPRPQILRSARIPGTRLYTDEEGYVLPSPWDHR